MNKIFYKIIESDPSDLQITVRFFSDQLTESELMVDAGRARTDYAITLPVPIPTADALHELIMQACPVAWFRAMHAARDPKIDTGMPHIAIGTVREVAPVVREPTFAALVLAKNEEIDRWRAQANAATFPHGGKLIACDALSRSDIDGVANHIALFETFPEGFPGGWKATDKTMLPLADVDAFRAMYASMTAQGTENFNHSQDLKAQLAAASTPEEIAAIHW